MLKEEEEEEVVLVKGGGCLDVGAQSRLWKLCDSGESAYLFIHFLYRGNQFIVMVTGYNLFVLTSI